MIRWFCEFFAARVAGLTGMLWSTEVTRRGLFRRNVGGHSNRRAGASKTLSFKPLASEVRGLRHRELRKQVVT
jgi:hypothetical protein